MAKWFFKDGGENGSQEMGTFREQMRDVYIDGVLQPGIYIEAMIVNSDDGSSAYWFVKENNQIVDSRTIATVYSENPDDTIWAFDVAQKEAEEVITKMPNKPANVEPETVEPEAEMPRRERRPRVTYVPVPKEEPVDAAPYISASIPNNDDYDENQTHWWENSSIAACSI